VRHIIKPYLLNRIVQKAMEKHRAQ
jgi:hypothetical protein